MLDMSGMGYGRFGILSPTHHAGGRIGEVLNVTIS